MEAQKIVGLIFFIAGMAFLTAMLVNYFKNKEKYTGESGSFKLMMPIEFVVYVLASIGISDFVMNTIISKKLKLNSDKSLPSTLVTTGAVPAAVMTFYLLRASNPVDIPTLLVFSLCLMAGTVVGNKVVDKLKGETIRKTMGILLIVSIGILIVKMILSRGISGELSEFSGWRFYSMALLMVIIGIINMMGVPGKPTMTAFLLIIGMSPIMTLTWMLSLSAVTPLFGGINHLKKDIYNHRMSISGAVGGTAGALIGCMLAISMNQTLLNIILLIVMAIAAYSVLKK